MEYCFLISTLKFSYAVIHFFHPSCISPNTWAQCSFLWVWDAPCDSEAVCLFSLLWPIHLYSAISLLLDFACLLVFVGLGIKACMENMRDRQASYYWATPTVHISVFISSPLHKMYIIIKVETVYVLIKSCNRLNVSVNKYFPEAHHGFLLLLFSFIHLSF